ncbi:MAG TPA: glycoside hydrolase family 76 protein [Flavisolibacter sp.]|nr:glycoside hydrolase family 76 protein [Flavisolibacter sp.]
MLLQRFKNFRLRWNVVRAIIVILCFLVSNAIMAQPGLKLNNRVYASKAESFFHKVWNYYRVPAYGLFSEYYPQQHQDTLTYMQEGQVASKPVSYLWPFSGMFTAAIQLMELPGRKQKYQPYLDTLVNGIERYRDTTRSPAGYQAYPSFLEKVDRYYDDNGLVGIDYLKAYEMTHDPAYLSRAKDAFAFIVSGWSEVLGGGVTWLEGHGDQKPACSNGMATLLALKLYKATHDEQYLQWGKRFYSWMHANLRDSIGLYCNDRKTANDSLNRVYYTYNSGSMLEASVMLFQFTKQKNYLSEARQTASSSLRFFGKKNKEGRISVLDLPWFVLVLFRGYESLYKLDRNPRYINVIIENVDYAWKQSKDSYGLINNSWKKGSATEMTSPKWLLDEACMIEFYARIALLK